MPKMPTKENLSAPGSLRSGRPIVTASDVDFSAVGKGMAAMGRGIAAAGANFQEADEKEKRKQDALDLIHAEAAQRQALFDAERQFDNDGDFATHDQRFTPMAENATKRAAGLIRNPELREKWLPKAGGDVLNARERLIKRADHFTKQDNIAQMEASLEGLKNRYSDPATSDADRIAITDQIKNSIELAKRGGVINPATAAKYQETFVKGALLAEAETRILSGDGESVRREILGKDAPLPVDDMANPETRAKPIGQVSTVPTAFGDYARGKGRTTGPRAAGESSGPVAPGREEGGRFVADGLNIVDRTDPNAQYGREATARKEQFQGIVLHHTGGEDADKFVRYGQSVDAERGGSFGYHFYIDKDGTILQGAPMDKRTNHVKSPTSEHRKDATGLANENAIGISLLGSGGDETPQQLAAAKQLADRLSATYGIDKSRIVGHGDLQNDRESREGQAALKAIRGEIATENYGAGAKGRYGMLSPLERADLVRRAETSIRTRLEGQREQLKQSLDDDVESIRNTGQPSTVDLDTAKRVLEPNQVNRYFLNRQEAELEYQTMNDLPALPNEALQGRLDAVAPSPGQPLFEMRQKVFEKAEREIGKLRELRDTDPAKSVETLPEVKAAATAVNANPEDPTAIQTLARARIEAQRKVGIPETQWSPITKAEARQLMAPVKGLEGASLTEAMLGVTEKLEQQYGPYARAAGIAAVEQIVHNRELAESIERNINRVFNGLPPTSAGQRRVEFFAESAQASRAFGGEVVGDPAAQYGPGNGRGQTSFANPTLGEETSGSAQTRDPFHNFTGAQPGEEAIKALVGNPASAPDFNRRYGAGAAEIILAQPIEELFPPAE